MNTTTLTVEGPSGPLEFECFDNWLSRWTSQSILQGDTYPILPFVRDVRSIVDVGANCGATSVLLAAHYPQAQVHALEPAREPYSLLKTNAGPYPNLVAHNVGLHAVDQDVLLYRGRIDSVTGSIFRGPHTQSEGEAVILRDAETWLEDTDISSVDVIKIDVEGCELAILRRLASRLPATKVVYVEYESVNARRELDELLGATHELAIGRMSLSQGEVTYISRALAEHEDAVSATTDALVRPVLRANLGVPRGGQIAREGTKANADAG